ncbi:MAG: TIGR03862 family flavoprotein [Akkermansiaceae bacterium]|jgi:hypothetical protein|nr:TIGR03862 family flavoprotein [Akkermansiaceae bacterium]
MTHTSSIAVIGGGPAGLRAAECAAAAGAEVIVFDGKPSVGRKFLVAGKGGLNLTHGETLERFAGRYTGPDQPPGLWASLLDEFSPADLRAWAAELGVETFQASSGRVYPKALKAAPLLRRWIARLKSLGVRFEMNHRMCGIEPGRPHRIAFENGNLAEAQAVILALGGASWPQTGSDGQWTEWMKFPAMPIHALVAANCGWEHAWPEETLSIAEGKPLKNISASAGEMHAYGELMVTRYGLEGGIIYQLGTALRSMDAPSIAIDFKPTFSREQLVAKMESVKRGFLQEAALRWKLSDAAVAILARKPWNDVASLAEQVKHCVIPLRGPRPIAEAISSAGGVCWKGMDESLMIRNFPGIFAAGEMIDWEAPTGGYLMQGCFATGTRAGRNAAAWLGTTNC